MKTLYEQLGGIYREENGRLIPEMKLPEQTNYQIGKYGQFYLDYIKQHRRGRYTTLLTEGTLNGRWYYGHGHQHGCQRGGNGGASGKCYRD